MTTPARQNYKICADLRIDTPHLTKSLAILRTGTASNFIRTDVIPSLYEYMLKHGVPPSLNGAKNRPPRMVGQVSFCVGLAKVEAKQRFFDCQRLGAVVIMGCNFWDHND